MLIEIDEVRIQTFILATIKDIITGSRPWLTRDAFIERMILVEIRHFFIFSKSLRFRDFLDPPKSKGKKSSDAKKQQEQQHPEEADGKDSGKRGARKRSDSESSEKDAASPDDRISMAQKIARMVTVVLKDFNFNFEMPMVDIKIKGGAESVIVSPTSSTKNRANTLGVTSLRGYYLVIDDCQERAMSMTTLENMDNLELKFPDTHGIMLRQSRRRSSADNKSVSRSSISSSSRHAFYLRESVNDEPGRGDTTRQSSSRSLLNELCVHGQENIT